MSELVALPCDDSVLREPTLWETYAAELRRLTAAAAGTTGADTLEVDELLVSRPLPQRYGALRNGVRVRPAEAADLIVGMAAGEGPYCRLTDAGKLQVESGWDGAVHFLLPARAAERLSAAGGRYLRIELRARPQEPEEVADPVREAADERFWARLEDRLADVTLLCERWAHGSHGCTWFRVTPENIAEVVGAVRPRSLLGVVVAADLRLDPNRLEEDFTAFTAHLEPGEVGYRAFPGGADSIRELTDSGFTRMLPDSALTAWCAVVPDGDGVVRGRWEHFEET